MEKRRGGQNSLNIIRYYMKSNYRIRKISVKTNCLSKVYKDLGKDDVVETVFGKDV